MNIGVLTSGGDCPGLNAALRALGKAGQDVYGMHLVGFRDGFRGLAFDQTMPLPSQLLSGILTDGGTILGTSRDKPHQIMVDGQPKNMIHEMVETFHRHQLEVIVCLGGGGTQKNALLLQNAGLPVITLPKTIDNDIWGTDVSFGFDTALDIATEALDRLHSTATSHHRIIVVEIMGHRAGWLALGAGIAGGADVILLPEIPYDIEVIAEAIQKRSLAGKRFSIIAVAEGVTTAAEAREVEALSAAKHRAETEEEKQAAQDRLEQFYSAHVNHTLHLTQQLEALTGQESRLTILGHLQRGGTPSSADRLLATRLGTTCVECIRDKEFGVMLAVRGEKIIRLPLTETAGRKKLVPIDDPRIQSARLVGTCFGDRIE